MRVKHMRNGQPINTSPSKAINIFFNKVGRKLITRGNVQGALEELDDAVDGLNSKLNKKWKYKDVKIDSVTTTASGYANLNSYIPTGITVIDANIQSWDGGAGVPYNITANGRYYTGTPNATITGLTIRYFYDEN